MAPPKRAPGQPPSHREAVSKQRVETLLRSGRHVGPVLTYTCSFTQEGGELDDAVRAAGCGSLELRRGLVTRSPGSPESPPDSEKGSGDSADSGRSDTFLTPASARLISSPP